MVGVGSETVGLAKRAVGVTVGIGVAVLDGLVGRGVLAAVGVIVDDGVEVGALVPHATSADATISMAANLSSKIWLLNRIYLNYI